MGVHTHPGTLPGGLTPICSACGISLCYDISQEDYEAAKTFWDEWKCEECNGSKPSLKRWKEQHG